jgi:hypothetical protein
MPQFATGEKTMNRTYVLVCLATAMLLVASSEPTQVWAADAAAVRAVFADPPREYSTAPLWVWNDMLTEEQIRLTLRDMAAQKVKQAFAHPRPGLMTPYLSDDWFRLWAVALDEAERLDMNIWVYDENSYPSGFAGGWVPELMPASRGRGLRFQEVEQLPKLGDDVLGVYVMDGDECRDVTADVRAGKEETADSYLVARVERAPDSAWTGGRPYVDLLHPGVTEKFIEVTMEPYRKRFGDQFGKRLPGWFTDEPHLSPFGLPHWSDHLPESFRQRWGYDLISNLPCLHAPVGDWKRVRHNYFQLLLEQFIDRWARPCYEYCERHNLEFTGHYWEHGWPGAGHGGDNMAMYAWHQRPGIDTLMNEYNEGVNAQFGNVRAVKELSSVANQLGRRRTLCEAYGAGGWDLRFEDMKRIGEWLVVLGVNTIDEHLSYITLRGTRKRDHPQSFSYHEPWWRAYHVMAESLTRLSAATSHGQQVNEILVLEPTTSTWMYQPGRSPNDRLREIGTTFQDLVNVLERRQVEYDLGCEDIIARHGVVRSPNPTPDTPSAARFVVGQRGYHTVVLPPLTENLNEPTMRLLEQFVAANGRVLCCGAPPQRVDGELSKRGRQAAEADAWQRIDVSKLPDILLSIGDDTFAIQRSAGDQGILFHQRRQLDDGQLLLLVNTSIEHPSSGVVQCAVGGVEQWIPRTGQVKPYPFEIVDDKLQLAFDLPPCGSMLLFLSDERLPDRTSAATGSSVDSAEGASELPARSDPASATRTVTIKPSDAVQIRRIGPNVLTLDFLDVAVGDEVKQNIYCYNATQFVFQKHGLDRNPWDHAVQFSDEFIKHKFPADSGFRATYRFNIQRNVPDDLQIVVERPDLYSISCNGKPVEAKPGAWWLDRAFGRIDLATVARVGANEVTLEAQPMTMFHEIESAYVLGDFSLQSGDRGWTIAPAKPLQLGAWNKQGMPYYAEDVAYQERFEIVEPRGRYVVRFPAWYGSVAEVHVNGHLAGHLVSRPWTVDVSRQIRSGQNTIEVRVIGTLKNTLGPHHGEPVLGKAWPWAFRQAPPQGPPPGERYHTVGYGLFKRPILENRRTD